jgi:hypothetical protein
MVGDLLVDGMMDTSGDDGSEIVGDCCTVGGVVETGSSLVG